MLDQSQVRIRLETDHIAWVYSRFTH